MLDFLFDARELGRVLKRRVIQCDPISGRYTIRHLNGKLEVIGLGYEHGTFLTVGEANAYCRRRIDSAVNKHQKELKRLLETREAMKRCSK